MALVTYEGWKCVWAASRGRVLMTRRLTRRVLGSDEWGIMLVNCLQKALAMSLFRVSVRWPEVMGWFGGVVVLKLLRSRFSTGCASSIVQKQFFFYVLNVILFFSDVDCS